MKKLTILALAAVAVTLFTGCAREQTKVTHSASATGTNSSYAHSSKSDALVSKIVIEKNSGRGLWLKTMGGSTGVAPFELGVGSFQQQITTIPTSTNVMFAAPLATTQNASLGIFNDAVNESQSTAPSLIPLQAYRDPALNNSNPIFPSVGTILPTNSLPVSVPTNAPAKTP